MVSFADACWIESNRLKTEQERFVSIFLEPIAAPWDEFEGYISEKRRKTGDNIIISIC
jgi:hypothetical protein